jgi:hypothetical protein
MGDPLKKVQPGQRLHIPAEAYNAFVDAALREKSRRHDSDQQSIASQLQPGLITVRNQTGLQQNRFSILQLTTPIVDPVNNLQQFKNAVTFYGIVPAEPLEKKTVAILIEPLDINAIGRAAIITPTPVQIDVVDAEDQFAEPVDATTANLQSGSTGRFRIIWKESGTGLKWAVVMLSGGPGGATLAYFRLTEDAETSSTVEARRCTYSGDYLTGDVTSIHNWHGLLDGAETDYVCLCGLLEVEEGVSGWAFVQGRCIEFETPEVSGGSSWSGFEEF